MTKTCLVSATLLIRLRVRSSQIQKLRGFLIALSLLLFCPSCEGRKIEVARVPSPDKALEAIVIESDDGGTVSYRYDLRIVSRGQPASDGISVGSLYGAMPRPARSRFRW